MFLQDNQGDGALWEGEDDQTSTLQPALQVSAVLLQQFRNLRIGSEVCILELLYIVELLF